MINYVSKIFKKNDQKIDIKHSLHMNAITNERIKLILKNINFGFNRIHIEGYDKIPYVQFPNVQYLGGVFERHGVSLLFS